MKAPAMKRASTPGVPRFWAALVAVGLFAVGALASERPAVGDVANGEKLFAKTHKKVRLDGAWINAYSDGQLVKGLQRGKLKLPKLPSDDRLDLYDVVAFLRSRNNNIRDLSGEATHVFLGKGVLDEYAIERLQDQAKVKVGKADKKRRVFALFKLGEKDKWRDIKIVRKKNTKVRDKLKPKKKVGYVVFMPLEGLRDGGYEAAIAVDTDIHITGVSIRGPDGTFPRDLNKAAKRLIGRGERGKYKRIKPSGAGKAVRELSKPFSAAFLKGMESIYMYEADERDYFAFDE